MRLSTIRLEQHPPWLPAGSLLRIPVAPEVRDEDISADEVDLSYVLEEGYRTPTRPLVSHLPFHYHRIPPGVRLTLARLLHRLQRRDPFPAEPAEPSVDAIRWSRGERPSWPSGRRFAVLLTHDVDTAEGMRRVQDFADLERAHGVRSTFFVCSHHYPLDLALLEKLEDDGFEIASHGYDHDNRIAFLGEAERARRLSEITSRLRPCLGIQGFRSPSLARTPGLFDGLEDYFLYDSSVPDIDLEGRGGCATVLPYRLGRLIEIPITLPMESSLLYAGLDEHAVFTAWKEKLAWIRTIGGVATAVLHTEPQLGGRAELRRGYAEFVRSLSLDGEAWVTTPLQLIDHLMETGFL